MANLIQTHDGIQTHEKKEQLGGRLMRHEFLVVLILTGPRLWSNLLLEVWLDQKMHKINLDLHFISRSLPFKELT